MEILKGSCLEELLGILFTIILLYALEFLFFQILKDSFGFLNIWEEL